MSALRTLLLIGSGPGIGSSVATVFASKGFNHIILISRDYKRLQDDRVKILLNVTGEHPRMDLIQADISDNNSLKQALQQVDALEGNIECVYFNAARVAPSPLLEFPIEIIESDFKTTTVALYTTAQWAIPKFLSLKNTHPDSKPSLLVTNSLLYKEPYPSFFSLSLVKAAQRNLVQSLHMVYRSQGIHIALVSVGGIVSDEKKVLNPRVIAQRAWRLFDQERAGWKLEVETWEE